MDTKKLIQINVTGKQFISGALVAWKAAVEVKPNTYRNWTNQRNRKHMHVFMIILVSGICSWVHTSDKLQHGTCCLPVDQMINLGCTFALVNFHIGDPFYGQLTAVKTRHPLVSITWPNRGLKCRTHWGQIFFLKLTLTRLWIFIGSQAQILSQITKTSQKFRAPLLGSAKSIY